VSNKSKHIAIVCNYNLKPERIGGMDRFFVAYDRALKGQGHTVHWYFSKYDPFPFFDDLDIRSAQGESVENVFLNTTTERYTTVITHFIALCTPFYKAIKTQHNARIIAVDHNPRPINGFPLKKRVKNRIKGLLYGKYIDLFVGVSQYSKRETIKDFGPFIKHKVIVAENGLLAELFIEKTSFKSNHKFIMTSHLRQDKGIQDVIHAVALIAKPLRDQLVIDVYGEGPYEENLKGLVSSLGLNEIFSFLGSVSNLNERYCQYDYLLHPTLGETFCYSVVEALFSKLPVLTTRNIGNVLGLVIEDQNGYLFNALNVSEIAVILSDLLLSKKVLNDCINPAHMKTYYSLSNMVERHLAII